MTGKLSPSRRSIVKLMSGASLLPLAGGGATAALLAACGGGDNASATPDRKATSFARLATSSTAFTYPGLTPNFDAAVTGLNLVEDMNFGSAAAPSGSPVGIAIKSFTDLATLFYPLQGVFNATGGHLGGTGPTTINSELQRYATQFNPQNHVFEADGLRLQAVLGAGHYDSYLRGSIVTAATANGFNAGADGASSPTRLVDIGLTVADLANIEIGTCMAGSGFGVAVVVAKDAAAGTITFEAVNSGIKQAYKGNHHITFTRFAFARVAADVINGSTITIQFKTPVASTVVPGMFALGVTGVSQYTPYANPLTAADRAKVLSVSADRLSVTFTTKVNFVSALETLTSTGGKTGDGVLFVPELTSGQIWAKRAYGPQQDNHQVQAVQVEFTMPAMPQFAGGGYYTKSAVESAMASVPGTMWGYWPAVWLYNFKPVTVPTYTFTGSEVDMLEVFTHLWGGQSTWTGYLHTQPYTRQVALQPGSTTIARNGGTWKASAADPNKLNTANAAQLLMPTPITSGTKRTVSIIWTRDKVLHYLDGIPVSESNWAVDTQYPHQLGINMACGSLAPNYAAALFFPQTDAQATGQFLTIHSIKTWEL
jgi:hypothetical protein